MTRTVGVIGGGTMGTGIAYVIALAGANVTVVEPDDHRADSSLQVIDDAVATGVQRGKIDNGQARAVKSRVQRVADIDDLDEALELVVESVPERTELKREVLKQVATRRPQIIATNTSALSIDELAGVVPAPDRFLGLHFFNPVWSIRLTEIVVGRATSKATLEWATQFIAWLGKESVTVRDVPGFATSRLDLIASLEAMRMLENGVASAADIDRAVVLAYRHPVGPLRLSDIVGLDVRLDVARTLERAHGERFSPPALLAAMVERGDLGQKTGKGFFDWPGIQHGS